MNRLKKFFAGLFATILTALGFLFGLQAEPVEATFNLTWQMPTERVNGDPITLAEIASTTCSYKSEGATDWVYGGVASNGETSLSITETLEPGNYEFACYVTDTDGERSIYTNSVVVTVEPPPLWPPNPPANLEVDVSQNF